MLNLLLESERAGVAALERLAPEVEQEELRQFLLGECEEEQRNVDGLEALIREGGGTPFESGRTVRGKGRRRSAPSANASASCHMARNGSRARSKKRSRSLPTRAPFTNSCAAWAIGIARKSNGAAPRSSAC